ncbi:MAG: lysozyme [Candidatus Acidiferrales bacterium]
MAEDHQESCDAGCRIIREVVDVTYKLSQDGLLALEKRECRGPNYTPDLVAYQISPNDPWTIGCGHTGPEVHKDLVWTLQQCYEALDRDVAHAADAINSKVTVPLAQNQFDALVSFVFNVGVGAFEKSSVLSLLNARNYQDVPDHMALYKYADGEFSKPNAGVVNRRRSEIGQWNQGAFVASATVIAAPKPPPPTPIKRPPVWLKTTGLVSVFSGSVTQWLTGDQITHAGHQLQDLATAGSSWHVFATIGGLLILSGILWEFFRPTKGP